MCGVTAKRGASDLNVSGSRPPLATRHIRCVLLVNSPNKLNLLSWLLIYLCNIFMKRIKNYKNKNYMT